MHVSLFIDLIILNLNMILELISCNSTRNYEFFIITLTNSEIFLFGLIDKRDFISEMSQVEIM